MESAAYFISYKTPSTFPTSAFRMHNLCQTYFIVYANTVVGFFIRSIRESTKVIENRPSGAIMVNEILTTNRIIILNEDRFYSFDIQTIDRRLTNQ